MKATTLISQFKQNQFQDLLEDFYEDASVVESQNLQTGNNITNCDYGMEFKGKRSADNGRLYATLTDNLIIGSTNGINMNNPHVDYLNITGGYISASVYAIFGGSNFVKTGHILVKFNYR